MKKLLPSLVLLIAAAQFGYTQITITSADLPIINDVVTTYTDTLAGVENTPGISGANQIWNYSGLSNHFSTTYAYLSVASTPYAASFPSANIAMTTDSNFYVYMNSSAALVTVEGVAGTLINPGDIVDMNPPQTIYELPLTYGDNFTDTYGIDFVGDGAAFGVYKIRFVRSGTVIDTVDGYGTLITPMGTYNSLRIKQWDNATDSIFIKLLSDFEPWSFAQANISNTLTYNWLANGGKMPIVQMNTDSAGNTTQMEYNEYPGTFGIQESNTSQITIGPNPFTEYILMNVPVEFSSGGDLFVQVMDINGKIVMNKTLGYSNQLSLDLSSLNAGMYIYAIHSNDHIATGKMIKQ